MRGSLLVLSGPSGAGKSTIIEEASKKIGKFYFSISYTTREPREGEVDGVDYHFISIDEFEKGIREGRFLEYAKVHNNYYGTSKDEVIKALNRGELVIFDIDVQGHRELRKKLGDLLVSIFITPPALKDLKARLLKRGSDKIDVINKRLENAKEEIKAIGEYDFVIINDDLKKAIDQFISIANASRCKLSIKEREDLIKQWL